MGSIVWGHEARDWWLSSSAAHPHHPRPLLWQPRALPTSAWWARNLTGKWSSECQVRSLPHLPHLLARLCSQYKQSLRRGPSATVPQTCLFLHLRELAWGSAHSRHFMYQWRENRGDGAADTELQRISGATQLLRGPCFLSILPSLGAGRRVFLLPLTAGSWKGNLQHTLARGGGCFFWVECGP